MNEILIVMTYLLSFVPFPISLVGLVSSVFHLLLSGWIVICVFELLTVVLRIFLLDFFREQFSDQFSFRILFLVEHSSSHFRISFDLEIVFAILLARVQKAAPFFV